MKNKYVIGFFCVLLFAAVLLTAGYQISYRHVMDRQAARSEEAPTTESISAEGDAVQEEGFYLSELQVYVVVASSDQTTIHAFTEIPLTELPAEVQYDVASGQTLEA